MRPLSARDHMMCNAAHGTADAPHAAPAAAARPRHISNASPQVGSRPRGRRGPAKPSLGLKRSRVNVIPALPPTASSSSASRTTSPVMQHVYELTYSGNGVPPRRELADLARGQRENSRRRVSRSRSASRRTPLFVRRRGARGAALKHYSLP